MCLLMEVVQSHPRCQTRPQSAQLVRSLPPQAEGIEQLIVDALYDLADTGYPTPQALGPYLASVAFGRADKLRPVVIEPPPVIVSALEALVGDVGARRGRANADEPAIRTGPHGEEGFGGLLIGGGGGREAKARDHPGGGDGGEQTEAFVRRASRPIFTSPPEHRTVIGAVFLDEEYKVRL